MNKCGLGLLFLHSSFSSILQNKYASTVHSYNCQAVFNILDSDEEEQGSYRPEELSTLDPDTKHKRAVGVSLHTSFNIFRGF